VFRVIWHKLAGWNVLRAAASKKLRAWVAEQMARLLNPDYSHPFKQSASESCSSGSGSAGLIGARTFPYPWCFAL
jgi:hypothetical protein